MRSSLLLLASVFCLVACDRLFERPHIDFRAAFLAHSGVAAPLAEQLTIEGDCVHQFGGFACVGEISGSERSVGQLLELFPVVTTYRRELGDMDALGQSIESIVPRQEKQRKFLIPEGPVVVEHALVNAAGTLRLFEGSSRSRVLVVWSGERMP
jgi:hypothetical protein